MKRKWNAVARIGLVWMAGALLHLTPQAQVGLGQMKVPGGPLEPATTSVALYYPTAAAARPVVMGPFTVTGAIQAEPTATVKGLIVLSHGTGGTERGHTSLAQALAQGGYLVAALRHPGDNWQDTSLRDGPQAASYFSQRPRQVSNVIDAVLRDPLWKSRIASDGRGPRVGALGHSAGGYTVLALAGGEADTARVGRHCAAEGATADPLFCGLAKRIPATPSSAPPAGPSIADSRVRAVAALAPLGVVFTEKSLAQIAVPTMLYEAEGDRFLVPRFHSGWVAQNVPNIERVVVPKAWHFVFMDIPNMPLPSPDGNIGADPIGFDRAAFLEGLGRSLTAFFDKNLR
jgi:predicted dienelactone hydrolase